MAVTEAYVETCTPTAQDLVDYARSLLELPTNPAAHSVLGLTEVYQSLGYDPEISSEYANYPYTFDMYTNVLLHLPFEDRKAKVWMLTEVSKLIDENPVYFEGGRRYLLNKVSYFQGIYFKEDYCYGRRFEDLKEFNALQMELKHGLPKLDWEKRAERLLRLSDIQWEFDLVMLNSVPH